MVAICRSGRRSQRAAEILTGRGLEATDVTGGMVAWDGKRLAHKISIPLWVSYPQADPWKEEERST